MFCHTGVDAYRQSALCRRGFVRFAPPALPQSLLFADIRPFCRRVPKPRASISSGARGTLRAAARQLARETGTRKQSLILAVIQPCAGVASAPASPFSHPSSPPSAWTHLLRLSMPSAECPGRPILLVGPGCEWRSKRWTTTHILWGISSVVVQQVDHYSQLTNSCKLRVALNFLFHNKFLKIDSVICSDDFTYHYVNQEDKCHL